MSELLLELFSEEIPARMQRRAAEDLARLVQECLAPLGPRNGRAIAATRRIALVVDLEAGIPAQQGSERGPRLGAPDAAIAGFLRKHGLDRDRLRQDGDYWVIDTSRPATDAAALIAAALPPLLRRFPWPKSMRWGESAFTWVRPLRRILCLLDGVVVPFELADGADTAHGLRAAALSEGHRFLAPSPFTVTSATQWQAELRARHVVLDAAERRRLIAAGIAEIAAARGLCVVEDSELLDEVTGLVEWPVPLLGAIDAAHMDLPIEVMQVSMRVNQRYFALRERDDTPAPHFAFVANMAAHDGGAAIVAGNERVLRARFADARHFWDADRRIRLADRLATLEGVTFHEKLGSQGARARRLARLAGAIAPMLGADADLAARAALLAKADLTCGMVGEFPELQGVMGGYYARHDGEDARVADAVRDHYLPKGQGDAVPRAPVSIAVALADKLDQLAAFFAIGERPSGSGDPFALRRAALGVIRIVRDNELRLSLHALFGAAQNDLPGPAPVGDLVAFVVERLRVQLRQDGARHDVLAAILAAGDDDDLVRLLKRTEAISALLATGDGRDLLAAYKRAANILRIEDKRDGPHQAGFDAALLEDAAESALAEALQIAPEIDRLLTVEAFAPAMAAMADLRAPLDHFFDNVTVNVTNPDLRRNRLALLSTLRHIIDRVADFSRIEG